MSDTPKVDLLFGMLANQSYPVPEPVFALAQEFERENVTLRRILKLIVDLDGDAHPGLMTWHDMRVQADMDAREVLGIAQGKAAV